MSPDDRDTPAPVPGTTPPPPPPPLYVPRNTGIATLGRAAKPDLAKVVSLTFTSDHAKLKDNHTDWKNTGALLGEPEFVFGKPSKPISQTRDTPLAVTIELEVYPLHLEARSYTIQGVATWGGMTFAATQLLKGGKQSVKLTSNEKLPDKIARLEGDIEWSIAHATLGSFKADHSFGHVIFVTLDTPQDDREGTRQEDGVTLKRMSAAIEWTAPFDTTRVHEIVSRLMAKIPHYTLEPDPAVPAQFRHPSFLGNTEGGAWPLHAYAKYNAECQAICRLMRAILRQVGYSQTTLIVVWAEPIGGKAVTKEADLDANPGAGLDSVRTVNNVRQRAVLIDGPVVVGRKYAWSSEQLSGDPVGPGRNRYEACLYVVVDDRETNKREAKYYGGGAGEYATKEEVIEAFWGLIWIEPVGDGYIVREIVKRYRY